MLSPATNDTAYFVMGFIISTTSRIWNRPCLDFLTGFCPVTIIIGMPPNCAYAAAVVKFVAPGPRVETQTPVFPVKRPYTAAINPAPCSCLVNINLILLDLLRLSRKSRFSSPGMPKTYSQPSASKHSINKSDAFVIRGFLVLV